MYFQIHSMFHPQQSHCSYTPSLLACSFHLVNLTRTSTKYSYGVYHGRTEASNYRRAIRKRQFRPPSHMTLPMRNYSIQVQEPDSHPYELNGVRKVLLQSHCSGDLFDGAPAGHCGSPSGSVSNHSKKNARQTHRKQKRSPTTYQLDS